MSWLPTIKTISESWPAFAKKLAHKAKISERITAKVSKRYEKTVGNKSAMPTKKPTPAKKEEIKLDVDLQQLDAEFNDDDAIEMEKEKSKGKK